YCFAKFERRINLRQRMIYRIYRNSVFANHKAQPRERLALVLNTRTHHSQRLRRTYKWRSIKSSEKSLRRRPFINERSNTWFHIYQSQMANTQSHLASREEPTP